MISLKILPAIITSIILFIPTFPILVELISETQKCRGDYNFCFANLFIIIIIILLLPYLWIILYMILLGTVKLCKKLSTYSR